MAYTLNIIKEGQTLNSFHVGRKQYATVPVKAGIQFQVLDEQGKLVKAPKIEMKGKDLWVFLEEGGRQPDIILQNYTDFGGVKDPAQLQKMNTTFATTTEGGTSNVPAGKQVAGRKAVLANEVDSAASKHDTSKFAKKGTSNSTKLKLSPSKSDYEQDNTEPDHAGESWSPYIALGVIGVLAVGALAYATLNDGDDSDKSSKSSERDVNDALHPADIPEGYTINNESEYYLISGNDSADSLRADTSDALMKGFLGNDVLTGGKGSDILIGGEGTDTLIGGEGNDILIGGEGVDTLTGDKGSDVFVFDVLDTGNMDIITDFMGGEDLITLSTSTKAFAALEGHADNIEDYISSENGILYYDDTGSHTSGAGVGFASLGIDDFDVAQSVTLLG